MTVSAPEGIATFPATITQAYRYALDPTPEQASLLRSHIGGTRFTYNALLELVQRNWEENRLKKLAGEEVGPKDYLGVSHFDLQKLWYQHRDELAPWWGENNSSTYNYACLNLSKAFTNWRKGRAKFPTRKKRGSKSSVSLMPIAVSLDGTHHVRISRVGYVKTYESTRKMHRHLARGTGKVKATTISQVGGRFFISFTLEVHRAVPVTRAPEKVVGIDAGLSTLYTGATPDGEQVLSVANPRPLVRAQQRLTHAQRVASRRQGPKRDIAPSNRWKKANARVQKVHASVANSRRNLIHETTSMLAKTYDVIVIEDLNIKGMVKNHSLAKHISDASWGEFSRQLEYKTKWYGSTLVKASRFYPSSKTCASCGHEVDRDLNAATNLARLGLPGTSSGTGRGGEVRPECQNLGITAHPDEASTETPPDLGA